MAIHALPSRQYLGGVTRGSAPYPAKKLFEKSFLDFQKLYEKEFANL
jgi:hypothetical protein